MSMQEITPQESIVPVFLDSTPLAPSDATTLSDEAEAARTAGVQKLMALGLTEDEARAIAGAP